eukprot:gnl/MRDRNA2_/MRDRNA2_90999_c0_seq1.p1 gnl/MRDRNA2_/MRDRNA2_90999_c0~~gnl/MRDRNA2_/MRDRNA2_90999_c0_seq1.p1  ORF type:complete len:234 (+),score=42.59 gnl/MRDRNA2_/MRDRNA2_90999_c0_seq1:82-702(+)
MFAACALVLVIAQSCSAARAALRAVPLGECYQCEVTCFEDCSLKFDREIIADDGFLQLKENPGKNQTVSKVNQTAMHSVVNLESNHTVSLREEYAKCLADSQCPCRAEAKVGKALQLMDKKKKTKCAVGMGSCSEKCSAKVIDKDIVDLSKEEGKSQPEAKRSLLQKRSEGFPLHPIKIGVFSKGKMTMASCMKYCLASTCGCHDA